jgi:hypothetical protein
MMFCEFESQKIHAKVRCLTASIGHRNGLTLIRLAEKIGAGLAKPHLPRVSTAKQWDVAALPVHPDISIQIITSQKSGEGLDNHSPQCAPFWPSDCSIWPQAQLVYARPLKTALLRHRTLRAIKADAFCEKRDRRWLKL